MQIVYTSYIIKPIKKLIACFKKDCKAVIRENGSNLTQSGY